MVLDKKIVVIDFDGVICDNGYNPNMEVIQRMNAVWKHHTIIIYTSRSWHKYHKTKTWLSKHDVKYDELIMGKPGGDVFIDDKNLSIKAFVKGRWRESTFGDD